MTPSYQSAVEYRRAKEQLEAPRRWAMANLEILDLVWSKFDADDDWPNARSLQRELFGMGERFDANVFARELPPMLGRLDAMSGKIAFTPRGLSFVSAARPVLDWMARLVQVAVGRYADQAGEPVIRSSEFEGLLGVDQRRARQLAQVLLGDSWLFRPAGGSIDDDQAFQVDETAVLDVRDVQSIEDYLEAQAAVWYPDAVEPTILQLPPQLDGTELEAQPLPAAVPGPLHGLHPLVVDASARHWENGHPREAIDRAAVAIVGAVRELAELPDLDGQYLMSRAFNPDAPRIVVGDPSTPAGRDLQRGTHFIAMGAMAGIRNVASHTLEEPSAEDARDQLAVFSLIARRLDQARQASWEKAQPPPDDENAGTAGVADGGGPGSGELRYLA